MVSRSRFFLLGAALVLATPFSAPEAKAAVVLYGDVSSYNAATTGNTKYDFNAFVPSGLFIPSDTVAVGPVTFTSDNVAILHDSVFGNLNFTDYSGNWLSSQGATVLSFTVAPGTTALAFNYGSYYGAPGFSFNLALSTGDVVSLTLPGSGTTPFGQPAFIGLTSSSAITGGTFHLSGIDIDDFTIGTAQVGAVPLPPALALFLSGLSMMGLFGWVRRRFPA